MLEHVKQKLYDGIPSEEIFHHITEFLDSSHEPFAKARYSLKQAIMALGPSGYPFEDFIAEILQSHGYTVSVRQILMGKCISHEVDVIAEKDDIKALVEVKFHNSPGIRSDVHVPLYTKSRFDDLKDAYKFTQCWIITNTKTTSDAIAYAKCAGIKTISWSYPDGESLRDLIEKSKLHPVTMLTTLSTQAKTTLLNNHIVMARTICEDAGVLDVLSLPPHERERAKQEALFVCKLEKKL